MLYANFIKKNKEKLTDSLKKRGQEDKIEWLNIILEREDKWRLLKQKSEKLRHKRNELTEKIRVLKTQNKSFESILKQAKEVPKNIAIIEGEMKELKEQIDSYLQRIPNILYDNVPVGKDENDNIPFRFYKERKTKK